MELGVAGVGANLEEVVAVMELLGAASRRSAVLSGEGAAWTVAVDLDIETVPVGVRGDVRSVVGTASAFVTRRRIWGGMRGLDIAGDEALVLLLGAEVSGELPVDIATYALVDVRVGGAFFELEASCCATVFGLETLSVRSGKKNLNGSLIFSPLARALRRALATLAMSAPIVRPRKKLPLLPVSP